MTALAKIVEPAVALSSANEDVLIHVRFLPSAEIFTIDGRPHSLSPREWFNRLYMGVPEHYRALANGRGFFRIPRPAFEALVSDLRA